MKKTLFLFILISLSTYCRAYDVCVDGIYYDLIAKTHKATVVKGDNKYSGDIVIPATIKVEGVDYDIVNIGLEAFKYCYYLTSISIPNSVTSIGGDAFYMCTSLTSILIPNSVTAIGEGTFSFCESLTSISIPNSVTSIDKSTFEGCYSLTSISIPNSVTSIGGTAFYNCTSLTSISIPNSVTSIENGVFSGCTSLTSISIPNSVTNIGWAAFYNCISLTSISIPNSVMSIDYNTFWGCSSLTSISIPNSVTSIGEQAFTGCSSLTSISIGNTVSKIYSRAFNNCKKLEKVICYAENVPSMGSDVFKDSYVSYATLNVPESSIDKYKAAAQWNEFGTIVGLNGSPETKKCSKPSIAFETNRLVYSTDTDGADIVSEVTVVDAKKSYENVVELTGVYEITAYATKSGWDDSEKANATLVWLNGSLTGTSNSSKIEVDAKPVLISSANGAISVTGLSDGDKVELYSADGKLANTVRAIGTTANCIADPGINIVKIGGKSIKVVVK